MDILRTPPSQFSRPPSLVFLVWITIAGTFPIHIFVPALPDAARELQVSSGAMQLSITAYLIGLSLGQLLLGILSDRFGRRPVLLAGLLLYVLASAVLAVAPNLATVLVARVFQALGGCSGLVLGRAITRDTSSPAEATARLAVLGAAISIGPAFAPIVGGQIALHFGWRAVFVTLAAMNAVLLAITLATLPETGNTRDATGLRAYFARIFALRRNAPFMRFCIGGAFATTSFYAFVGAAPFILKSQFGLSPDQVGFAFLVVVGSLTLGSLCASRLAGRLTPLSVVRFSGCAMLAASLLLLWLTLADRLSLYSLHLPVMALSFAIGLCSPFAMSAAISAEPRAIGAASGLYGCLQMGTGAAIIAATGLLPLRLELSMALVLTAASAIAALAFCYPAGGFRK